MQKKCSNEWSVGSATEHRPERRLFFSFSGVLKLDLEGADLFLWKIVTVVSVLLVGRGFIALDGHSHHIVLHLGTDLLDLEAYETSVVDERVLF